MLDATAMTGTITIDGVTYPISDELPEEVNARRLQAIEQKVPDRPVHMKPVAAEVKVNRRMLRRGKSTATIRRTGVVSTGGSFAVAASFMGNF